VKPQSQEVQQVEKRNRYRRKTEGRRGVRVEARGMLG